MGINNNKACGKSAAAKYNTLQWDDNDALIDLWCFWTRRQTHQKRSWRLQKSTKNCSENTKENLCGAAVCVFNLFNLRLEMRKFFCGICLCAGAERFTLMVHAVPYMRRRFDDRRCCAGAVDQIFRSVNWVSRPRVAHDAIEFI